MKNTRVMEDMERRILHGLSCEWEAALEAVSADASKTDAKAFVRIAGFQKPVGILVI